MKKWCLVRVYVYFECLNRFILFIPFFFVVIKLKKFNDEKKGSQWIYMCECVQAMAMMHHHSHLMWIYVRKGNKKKWTECFGVQYTSPENVDNYSVCECEVHILIVHEWTGAVYLMLLLLVELLLWLLLLSLMFVVVVVVNALLYDIQIKCSVFSLISSPLVV